MWEDEGVYDDQLPMFLLRGHWILGWPKGEKPLYDERIAKMKVHDRIAIKSMDGKGADTVTIKALGMVKNIDESTESFTSTGYSAISSDTFQHTVVSEPSTDHTKRTVRGCTKSFTSNGSHQPVAQTDRAP